MKYICISCGHQTDTWPQSGDTVQCPECLHKNTLRKSENVPPNVLIDPSCDRTPKALDEALSLKEFYDDCPFIPGRF